MCGGGDGIVPVPGAGSGQTSSTGHGAWSTTNLTSLPRLFGPSRDRSPSLATMSRAAPSAAATTSRSGNPPPANPASGPAKLAAFSVTSGPGPSTTLTLHKGSRYARPDPAALRRALARHGIPALVTVGTFCRPSTGAAAGQTNHLLSPTRSGLVINGQAMPPGTKLSIGLFPQATRMLIVKDGSRLSCSGTSRQPAVHITPTGTPIRG